MELSCPEKKSPEQDRKSLDWMNSILFTSAFDEMTFLQDGSKTRSILTKWIKSKTNTFVKIDLLFDDFHKN